MRAIRPRSWRPCRRRANTTRKGRGPPTMGKGGGGCDREVPRRARAAQGVTTNARGTPAPAWEGRPRSARSGGALGGHVAGFLAALDRGSDVHRTGKHIPPDARVLTRGPHNKFLSSRDGVNEPLLPRAARAWRSPVASAAKHIGMMMNLL